MSSDIVLTVYYVANVVALVILAFGAFRAFQIGRFFVNRTYRSRAYTGGALMFVIMLGTSTGLITLPNSDFGVAVGELAFGAILVFLMAFLDRGIFVAMDGDIFHRDILRWKSARLAAYAVLIASVIVANAADFLPYSGSSLIVVLATNQLLVVVPILFAYAVVSLLVGGRRTPDRTVKRHIRLLGIGFTFFIVAFPFFGVTADAAIVFANVVIIFADWFLYRAVMSLSDVGKVRALEQVGLTSGATPV